MSEQAALRQADIEVLKETYAAFNRGDYPAMMDAYDPEMVWIIPEEYGGGGTARGRADVEAFVARGRSKWADGTCEPERFIIAGDKIVVIVHVDVLLQGQTERIDGRHAAVYTYRNGRIVERRVIDDIQEALGWAGATDEALGVRREA